MMQTNEVNFETILDFPKTIAEQFSDEVRDYAASTLVDALLASCETQEERIELGISLLGYDPRCE